MESPLKALWKHHIVTRAALQIRHSVFSWLSVTPRQGSRELLAALLTLWTLLARHGFSRGNIRDPDAAGNSNANKNSMGSATDKRGGIMTSVRESTGSLT